MFQIVNSGIIQQTYYLEIFQNNIIYVFRNLAMYQNFFQRISGLLWLSLLILPTASLLRFPKVILLALLIPLVIFLKPYYNKTLLYFLIAILLYACFNTLLGLLYGNPGALRVLTVTMLWPILFFIISGHFKIEYIKKVEKIFKASAILILILCVFQLSENFYQYNGISDFFFNEDSKSYINIEKAYASFSNPAMASLLFIGPFFISRFILEKRKSDLFFISFILLIGFIANRRGLLLAMGISIPVLLSLMLVSGRITISRAFGLITKSVMFIFLVGLILIYFYPDLSTNFQNRFFENKEASNIERANQFPALLNGFYESIFIGKGAGAVASVVRSYEQPWSYELFYLSILFHQGLIGFFLYLSSFSTVIYFSLILAKKYKDLIGNHLIIIICASTVFLIISATNPYIGKLDYMWIIFYPITLINFFSRNKLNTNISSQNE